MSPLSPPPTLSALPSEIQNTIIDLLDIFDRLILRTTSRHFRRIISISIDDLLTAEQALFSCETDLLGCYDCLCLRRAACFADNVRKGKRGRWGNKYSSRFCIDCGLNPRSVTTRYNRDNTIVIGGKQFMTCWCEKHGIVPKDSFNENRWVCITCWEPVARRRRAREREQQNIQYQQEKAAKAKARAERRARLRDLGWAGSEIEDMVSESTISDEDTWSVYSG
ncbi:hypothetical protein FOQG_18910 [Fusarium oxysporum f. sp. raphani 54005]|uniref:F-box domain-containing protein n=1 Tax=Fusarium oxysporum f. sp. raphani 54005 TaxID=1089458 RepID=X0BBZ4_FUSOX|nr:hypothetical protein FOQG_18910 [Fusarium oxysporum f. sp. raphani 54005]